MSKDLYATALKIALTEIKNVCPGIKSSFIFSKEGVIVAGDLEDSVDIKRALDHFQNVKEKADAIGGIEQLSVNGTEGNIQISQTNDMFLATATSRNVDKKDMLTITGVIVPTILKLLENITQAPAPPKTAPLQQLTAKKITGFFAGDYTEIDKTILTEWSEFFNGKTINIVEIQAPNGKTARCKVKAIDDERLEGKGLIRIPEKTLRTLKVGEEEIMGVKPITP